MSVRDNSRRKELETELVHNASHDVLTGLPHRALRYERLAAEIEHGGEFAVLCVDLDGFKRVNDEFVIIHVTDAPPLESAVALAQCVIEAASAPMAVAEWSGSIGIALAAGSPAHGEDILRAADRAIYEAKASGRNAYRIAGSV